MALVTSMYFSPEFPKGQRHRKESNICVYVYTHTHSCAHTRTHAQYIVNKKIISCLYIILPEKNHFKHMDFYRRSLLPLCGGLRFLALSLLVRLEAVE